MVTIRDIQKLLAPLTRRLRLVASRGIVKLVDDSFKLQGMQVQVYADDLRDGVERFQNYGISSVPFAEAEAIVLALGGNASHTVVIAVDDRRYRLKGMAEGEVALYDDQGQKVHLTRAGIVIDTSKDVTVTAGGDANVTATGNATIAGAEIHLNGQDGMVVTTAHPCAFTGNPHPAGSSTCKAGA